MQKRDDLRLFGALSGLVWIAVVGCGGAHMALPKEFQKGMDKLESDGRPSPGEEEPFELSPYQVESIERKLSNTDGFDIFENFKPTTEGGYHFSISGGKEKLTGRCAPRSTERVEDIDGSVTIKDELGLACTCEKKGKSVARLMVEDLAGEYGGPLVVGEVQARATGVYKLENGDKLSDRPAGYRVDDDEGAVAAIDLNAGEARVWIKHGLKEPERQRVVCALVGLTLWTPSVKKKKS